MRNPNRIPEILATLKQAWEKFPDWSEQNDRKRSNKRKDI